MLLSLGDSDRLVSYSFGKFTAQFLNSINPQNHLFKTYEGLGHTIDPKVSNNFNSWLIDWIFRKCLKYKTGY